MNIDMKKAIYWLAFAEDSGANNVENGADSNENGVGGDE